MTTRRRDLLFGATAIAAAGNLPAPAVAQGVRELKMVTDWAENSPGQQARRFLQDSHEALGSRVGRVHQQSDYLGLWNQLGKQLKPLGHQFGLERAVYRPHRNGCSSFDFVLRSHLAGSGNAIDK